MPSCSVKFCNNHNKNTRDTNIHYHRFPKNLEIRKKWQKVCGVKELNLENVHFEESCYEQSPSETHNNPEQTTFRRLKKLTVSTKNLAQDEIFSNSIDKKKEKTSRCGRKRKILSDITQDLLLNKIAKIDENKTQSNSNVTLLDVL